MNIPSLSPALAMHYFFEICPVSVQDLNNPDFCQQVLYALAEAASVTPLQCVSNQFFPQGCSVALLLSESHASIHTWPEHQLALIDLFSCQPKTSLPPLLNTLQKHFPEAKITHKYYPRGYKTSPLKKCSAKKK